MKRICVLLCIALFFVSTTGAVAAISDYNSTSMSFDIPGLSVGSQENQADYGNWKIKHFVDDFNQPTDLLYVRNINPFVGNYSNAAVYNGELNAFIGVDLNVDASPDNPQNFFVWIDLFTGQQSIVKNTTENTITYTVNVIDGEEKRYTFDGYMNPQTDYLFFNSNDSYELINILKLGGRIQFVIDDTEDAFTRYHFIIDNATGFASAYAREIVFADPVAAGIQGMYYTADEWFSSDELCSVLLHALLEESGHLEWFIANESIEDVYIINYGTNFQILVPYGEDKLGYIFFPGSEPFSDLYQIYSGYPWTREQVESLGVPYKQMDAKVWNDYLAGMN